MMALGSLVGLSMWNSVEAFGRKKLTRTGIIVRFVLFISLMMGLLYDPSLPLTAADLARRRSLPSHPCFTVSGKM
jgi:hypothetical protein